MATTFTATRAADSFPVFKASGSGILNCAWGTIAISTNVVDGDIWEMCKVPAGSVIVGGYLHMEDLDTGTEVIDLMVGYAANGSDSADPNGLLLAGAKTGDISVHLDVASTWMPLQGAMTAAGPTTLANETTIQVEANTAADTFAAGQMSLYVYYLSP